MHRSLTGARRSLVFQLSLGVWAVSSTLACGGSSGGNTDGKDGGGAVVDGGYHPCVPDPCAALAGTQCLWGRCVAGALTVASSSSAESLSGTYAFVASRPELWFWTTLDSSGGAQAVLQLEGSAEQATVTLVNKDSVQMLWAAQTITGNGVLPDAAAVALAEFAASPLAEAAALAALEIGCGTTSADPMQLAALLAPWQLVLKYVRADRVDFAKSLASRVSCTYFAKPSSTHSLTMPTLLQLGFDDPIPNVFGIFPFDDVGAVEASPSRASLKKSGDLSGPCGAMCRGACGPDCTTNTCTLRGTGRCESDPAGRQTGNWVTANVYRCGTHQACREHDDCYDTCNNGRCASWAAASCRRKCDLDTIGKWPAPAPYWWARGYGAVDNHIEFEYPDPPRYDPLLCPFEGGGLDASADGSTDLRNLDVPSGTPDAGRPDASVVPDVSPDRPEDTVSVQDAPIMNTGA